MDEALSLLEIRGLTKTYANGTRALDGVDLDVGRGLFGLLGPNGAGKSTLMRTIATLQAPDAGRISFDGIDGLAQPEAVRRVLGYLPQEFGVYPGVSAEALLDHLAILKGLTRRGERRDEVRALLERTNLAGQRKQAVSSFSGGMRQRFGVAQALLGGPRLLIVDEPTAGLDPAERGRFLDLICEVGETVAVIFSTHLVDDVRELCRRMAILHRGRVLLSGEPEQRIQELEGRVWSRTCAGDELRELSLRQLVISTRRRGGSVIAHVLSEEAVAGCAPVRPDLEDVYFATMARAGSEECVDSPGPGAP